MNKSFPAYVVFIGLAMIAVTAGYRIWHDLQPKPEQQVVSFCKTDKCPTLPMQVPQMIKLPMPCYLDQESTPVFCPKNLEVYPSPEPSRTVHTVRVPPTAQSVPPVGPTWRKKDDPVPLPKPRPNIIVEVKPSPKPVAAKPKPFPAPRPALKQWPDTIRNDLP